MTSRTPTPLSSSSENTTDEAPSQTSLSTSETEQSLPSPAPKRGSNDLKKDDTCIADRTNHSVYNDENGRNQGFEDLAICASPSNPPPPRKRKKKAMLGSDGAVEPTQSLASVIRQGIVNHQLGLSLNLILLVAFAYILFPSLRYTLSAYLWLSYKSRNDGMEGMYGQGPRDLQLVVALVVAFTGVRAFMLDYVLMPLAGICGIKKTKGRVRFAEQSYLLSYYVIYWTWGLQLLVKDTPASLPLSPKFSSFEALLVSLWTNFPKLLLTGAMKVYYLSQMAFWLQQILVIHLEEKRKDHYQMLTHHFVTVALMSTSYGFRQWRVGNAVLVCMDVVDLIFPLAKILKYMSWQRTCDAAFALFVVLWLLARHLAYLSICWSIYAHVHNETMAYGTYSLRHEAVGSTNSGMRISDDGGQNVWKDVFQVFLNPEAETLHFNARIRFGFLGLLLGLQCITLMWFIMILRVVMKVVRGEGADDTRSDDEDGDSESEDLDLEDQHPAPHAEKAFIEIEAEASELNFAGYGGSGVKRVGSGSRKTKGFSSSLHLGDRKDILNRIGCLSEEQLSREREKKGESSGRPGSR